MITVEQLKIEVHYNPETGLFKRLVKNSNNTKNGYFSGSFDKSNGYFKIRILEKQIYAHRLAWLYMTGEWPNYIDHKDGNKQNNKFENLRSVNQSQNIANSKRTRTVGVCSEGRKWRAKIKVDYQYINLGLHLTQEAAIAARKEGEKKYFGEYAYEA